MNKIWSDIAWEEYLQWQMLDRKTLKKINGLILGDFSRLGTQADKKILDSLIKDYFKNSPYPVARFKKYSHEKGHVVIPFGGIVHLNSHEQIITLKKQKKMR